MGSVMRSKVIAAVVILLTGAASTATASTLDLFGYGARGQGMAGVVTSTATGHESVYYNPSGLAFDTQSTFRLGFQRADYFLEVDGVRQDTLASPALVLGFGVPIPFGSWLRDRLSLGVGFVLPTTTVLRADIPTPGVPDFTLVANRAQTISIQGAVSAKLLEGLSMGIGFLALSDLEGKIGVTPDPGGEVSADVQDNLLASYSLVGGATWKPTDWLNLGFVIRGESRANFTIPIEVDFGPEFGIPIPDLDIRGTAQYDPAQWTAEVSGRPVDAMLVGVGVTRKLWSGFGNPVVYTAVPEGYPAQPEPGFDDTWVWRVGGEGTLRLGDWHLKPRLGVVFEPTPVPDQTGLHNHLDNDRTILTAGGGVTYDNLTLDVAVQRHSLPAREHIKDPSRLLAETTVAEEALTGAAGEETPAGYPEIAHGGAVWFWSAELGVMF